MDMIFIILSVITLIGFPLFIWFALWVPAVIFFLILLFLIIYHRMSSSVSITQRLDKDGMLYYAKVKRDYHNVFSRLAFRAIKQGGCSAFATVNEKGEFVTGRNYDMPHFDGKKNLSGLNVVLENKGFSKYASINGVDACWLSVFRQPYYKGAFDNPWLCKLFQGFLPYLVMDGINEKGLCVSILALDLKEGEQPVNQKEKGKRTLVINELVREMLDECADLKEAVQLAESVNLTHMLHHDYHLFVSDASGKHAVLEWRHNTLTITDTDACTNFYVNSDDGCDCIIKGQLKEKFSSAENTLRPYRYGYGHGYDRFVKLVKMLNSHIDSKQPYSTKMSEKECWNTLQDVSQQYNGMLTSCTQYSCLYNNTDRSATYSVGQDYNHKYIFDFKKDEELEWYMQA